MANMDEKIPIFGKGMRNTGKAGKNDSKSKMMGKRTSGGGKGGNLNRPGIGQPIKNPPGNPGKVPPKKKP